MLKISITKKHQLSKSHLSFLINKGFEITEKGRWIGKCLTKVTKTTKK
jgi:hypothetical protein